MLCIVVMIVFLLEWVVLVGVVVGLVEYCVNGLMILIGMLEGKLVVLV